MIISDGAIKLDCPSCGAKRIEVGFDIQMHYMWKNKNGCCIRIFCYRCGTVNNLKQIYSKGDYVEITKQWTFNPLKELPF